MELDPLQQEAVDACTDIANRVVAVTGAAGSGKTTILKMVYDVLTANGYRVALCSPTGKAAKRIFEATGIEASTIHRLLKYSHPGDPDPKTGKPMGYSAPYYCRERPLEDFDVILADEYAMVNTEVHRSLFDAIPPGCVVRCFGDDNQLAPIEEGQKYDAPKEDSPFLKLLKNPKIKSIVLKTVFRQGQDSGILFNLTNLLKSKMPTKNEQWNTIFTDQPVAKLREYIEEMAFEHEVSFASLENQVIVPQNTSWVGTKALNVMIQGLFHNEQDPCVFVPRKPTYSKGGDGGPKDTPDAPFYIGDKVIFQTNNYDLGIFNGESGILIEADDDTGELVVDFGDREQAIPPVQIVMNRYGKESTIDPRKDLDLAYAITTHKSQGSEYKRGVYIINKSNMFMLNRRNFYTAASRFREHLLVLADQRGVSNAVYKRD